MASTTLLHSAGAAQDRINDLRLTRELAINGANLDIGGIVAIARHNCSPTIKNKEILNQLSKSVEIVKNEADSQKTVYGVNTGFGGSADLRTTSQDGLERALMQTLQSAVTTSAFFDSSEPGTHDSTSLRMPPNWVKATIVARLNQCLRGHSAISREVIETVVQLMQHEVLPIVPLRGSISSSGDLMPLSYLAGLVEGSPDVFVTIGSKKQIYSAAEALIKIGKSPTVLGPREGLGLVNGTAASVATAALAMYDSFNLVLMATSITGLACEGLAARTEWLSPFVNEIQPHPGQAEVSEILRKFLSNSALVTSEDTDVNGLPVRPSMGLAQDRYPLRTSPQWLGPQFEDLMLAYSQISTELNSTTDNPVTDPRTRNMYHVGNFQAASVTTAVEKMRSSLQMAGKMLFAQFTEMVNHTMSCGLPSNLAADDPSVSFCMKGLDINMAAYQAELAFLSNPVSSHVQSAEMHNQAINSLAFLSTRYTQQAIDVLSLMVASSLYAVCQAVDLRVMHATFLATVVDIIHSSIASDQISTWRLNLLKRDLSHAVQSLQDAWWNAASQDADRRCHTAAVAFAQSLTQYLFEEPSKMASKPVMTSVTVHELDLLRERVEIDLLSAYKTHQENFLTQPTTEQYLGAGSKLMYNFVRETLQVPMHRGLVDHPTSYLAASRTQHDSVNGYKNGNGNGHISAHETNGNNDYHSANGHVSNGEVMNGNGTTNGIEETNGHQWREMINGVYKDPRREQKTIGSQVAIIHNAVRDGHLFAHNVRVLRELGLK